MKHIILLGDSIFDNAVYVPGGPAVMRQLRSVLPRAWEATLLAVDGSVTTGMIQQVAKVPESATHLIVNDCIPREAITHGLPVLDLRLICAEAEDYANEIEPGVPGGRKIAAGILNLVPNHDLSSNRTAVYT